MPAVYAHYKFGKKVYRALPEDVRRLVRENAPAYWLGLHGPDLLFYYRAMGKNRVNQLGVRMHRESARFFFEKARRVYRKRPSYVLLSYLCGFLCHFACPEYQCLHRIVAAASKLFYVFAQEKPFYACYDEYCRSKEYHRPEAGYLGIREHSEERCVQYDECQ